MVSGRERQLLRSAPTGVSTANDSCDDIARVRLIIMDIAKLKKQIEQIDKLAADGKTVNVTLRKDNKQAHFKVVGKRATRLSAKKMLAATAMTVGAAAGKTFSLDFDADITDAEIIKKIKGSSGSAPAAAASSSLPVVLLTRDDQRGVWILAAACSYAPDNMNPAHTITASKDFEFDLASIPRIFWSILAPEELSLAAPLFHDLLYRRGGKLLAGELAPPGHIFKRAAVDTLFLELMTKAGIPKWKRKAAYLAVRGFSGFAWKD